MNKVEQEDNHFYRHWRGLGCLCVVYFVKLVVLEIKRRIHCLKASQAANTCTGVCYFVLCSSDTPKPINLGGYDQCVVSKDGIFDSIKQRRGVIDCRIKPWCLELPVFWLHVRLSGIHFVHLTPSHMCMYLHCVSIVLSKHPWVLVPPSTNIEGGHEGGALMAAQKWVLPGTIQ